MPYLYELIQQKATDWRRQGYPAEEYPAIAEILDYATLPEIAGLRYLHQAQLRALETYWYLRLVEGMPHVLSSTSDTTRAVYGMCGFQQGVANDGANQRERSIAHPRT
jgi:hypothetical protein